MKKIKFSIFFLQNFMFSSHFMPFPTFKNKFCVKKNFGGEGGGVLKNIFLEKQLFLISRFMLFSTLKKIILKSAPSLTG